MVPVLVVPVHYRQCISGTHFYADSAGDAFERNSLTPVEFHALRRADIVTDQAFDAEFFLQHDHAEFINRKRIGSAHFHAFGALVADCQMEIVVSVIDDVDTGFFRVFLFEVEVGAGIDAAIAADTFFIVCFQYFSH